MNCEHCGAEEGELHRDDCRGPRAAGGAVALPRPPLPPPATRLDALAQEHGVVLEGWLHDYAREIEARVVALEARLAAVEAAAKPSNMIRVTGLAAWRALQEKMDHISIFQDTPTAGPEPEHCARCGKPGATAEGYGGRRYCEGCEAP